MSLALQTVITVVFVIGVSLYPGRNNASLIDKLLMIPAEQDAYEIYEFQIDSRKDANEAVASFIDICQSVFSDQKKINSCTRAWKRFC